MLPEKYSMRRVSLSIKVRCGGTIGKTGMNQTRVRRVRRARCATRVWCTRDERKRIKHSKVEILEKMVKGTHVSEALIIEVVVTARALSNLRCQTETKCQEHKEKRGKGK